MEASPDGQDPDRRMHIGEVADLTGLSLRTLRFYDDSGVVSPSGRTSGGHRLYTGADVQRLLIIKRMKPLGFSLEEIAGVVRMVDALEAVAAADPGSPEHRSALGQLEAFLEVARERVVKMRRNLEWAEEFASSVHERAVRHHRLLGTDPAGAQ